MLRGLQLHMISLFLHRQYGIVVANIMLGDMKSRWSWTGLFVCTLKKPVSYEGKKTSVLFMIGLRNRADRKLMVFYKLIGLLLSHPMGHATIPMPRFSIIYVKRTDRTPKMTTITFTFPDGQRVDYESENVILEEFTKEYIVEKQLFPYIPFHIARYEKELTSGHNIDAAVEDLIYFRNEMVRLHEERKLSDAELIDLMGFVNTIITHITNGNKDEERLVNIMGGTIIETESEKWMRRGMQQGMEKGMQQGQAKMIIELGQESGLDDEAILKRLREKIGLSLEEAKACVKTYGNSKSKIAE